MVVFFARSSGARGRPRHRPGKAGAGAKKKSRGHGPAGAGAKIISRGAGPAGAGAKISSRGDGPAGAGAETISRGAEVRGEVFSFLSVAMISL